MLSVGELALRRVSKFEVKAEASARGTKFNFRLTSRIQVSCCYRSCSPPCGTYVPFILTVVTCRPQHMQYRCFREEPPRQAWPPTFEPSSGVDNFWCVSVQRTSSSKHHANVIVVCNRSLLSFSYYFVIPLHGSEVGRRAPTHLFSRLLPVLRYPLY